MTSRRSCWLLRAGEKVVLQSPTQDRRLRLRWKLKVAWNAVKASSFKRCLDYNWCQIEGWRRGGGDRGFVRLGMSLESVEEARCCCCSPDGQNEWTQTTGSLLDVGHGRRR